MGKGSIDQRRCHSCAAFIAVALVILCLVNVTSLVAAHVVPVPVEQRPVRQNQPPVTIEFWHIWDEFRTQMMKKVIERFEATYPWIKVKQDVLQWHGRREKTIMAYAGGSPPDLLMTQRWEVPWFASQGMIAPIDGFIKERELDLAIFFPAELGGFWYEGRLYSLPMPGGGATTYIGVYNKQLLSEAGLPDRFPETWREYNEYTRILNKWDSQGNLVQIAGPATSWGLFRPLLYCNGSKYITDDGTTITFDTKEAIEVIEWQIENRDLYRGTPRGGSNDFYAGKQAMIFHNQSIFGHLKVKAPQIRYGVGVMPYNSENPNASGHGIIDAGWGYVIPNTAPPEKQYAAYLLLEWLTAAKEGGVWFLKQQGRPSAVIEYVVNDPDFYELNQDWEGVVKVLMADISIPITPVDPEIRQTISHMYRRIFGEGVPVKEALVEAQQKAQQLLDEFYSGQKR